MKKLMLLFVSMLLVSGCMPRIYTETGRRFDTKSFDSIKPGMTKKDLTAFLGEPQQTGIKESGKEIWTYVFLSMDYPSRCIFITEPPEIEHDFMRMTVTFDGDNVFEKSYEATKKAK